MSYPFKSSFFSLAAFAAGISLYSAAARADGAAYPSELRKVEVEVPDAGVAPTNPDTESGRVVDVEVPESGASQAPGESQKPVRPKRDPFFAKGRTLDTIMVRTDGTHEPWQAVARVKDSDRVGYLCAVGESSQLYNVSVTEIPGGCKISGTDLRSKSLVSGKENPLTPGHPYSLELVIQNPKTTSMYQRGRFTVPTRAASAPSGAAGTSLYAASKADTGVAEERAPAGIASSTPSGVFSSADAGYVLQPSASSSSHDAGTSRDADYVPSSPSTATVGRGILGRSEPTSPDASYKGTSTGAADAGIGERAPATYARDAGAPTEVGSAVVAVPGAGSPAGREQPATPVPGIVPIPVPTGKGTPAAGSTSSTPGSVTGGIIAAPSETPTGAPSIAPSGGVKPGETPASTNAPPEVTPLIPVGGAELAHPATPLPAASAAAYDTMPPSVAITYTPLTITPGAPLTFTTVGVDNVAVSTTSVLVLARDPQGNKFPSYQSCNKDTCSLVVFSGTFPVGTLVRYRGLAVDTSGNKGASEEKAFVTRESGAESVPLVAGAESLEEGVLGRTPITPAPVSPSPMPIPAAVPAAAAEAAPTPEGVSAPPIEAASVAEQPKRLLLTLGAGAGVMYLSDQPHIMPTARVYAGRRLQISGVTLSGYLGADLRYGQAREKGAGEPYTTTELVACDGGVPCAVRTDRVQIDNTRTRHNLTDIGGPLLGASVTVYDGTQPTSPDPEKTIMLLGNPWAVSVGVDLVLNLQKESQHNDTTTRIVRYERNGTVAREVSLSINPSAAVSTEHHAWAGGLEGTLSVAGGYDLGQGRIVLRAGPTYNFRRESAGVNLTIGYEGDIKK